MKSKNIVILLIVLVVALAGLAAVVYQALEGLIVTNMRNPFSWGLYIVMWAFFVGTAAGGLVVTSATYLFKIESLKPFSRIAALTAFMFTIAAMVMLLPDLGRPDRLLNLFIYPQFGSVLIWDLIVLSAYAVFSAVYTYLLLRPALARKGIRLPVVGQVGKKNVGEAEVETIEKTSEMWARYIAPAGLVIAISIHTVTAWVLATQLARSWWFGGALAPTFIASAVASGPSVVILAALYVLGHKQELASAYATLGKISAFGAVILLFIYYNDFVVKAWWGQGTDFETLAVLLGNYLPLHLAEAILIITATVVLVKLARRLKWLVAGSLSMIAGVLVHRFVLLPSAFNVIPFRVPSADTGGMTEWPYPIAVGEIRATLDAPQSLFVSWWNYVPSPIELVVCAGLICALIVVFVILTWILPLAKTRE